MKGLSIALLTVLAATVGHAADDIVVVDGVVYTWYENSNTHEYGYVAARAYDDTPIQSLHIRGEVDDYQVYGIAAKAFEDNPDIIYLTIDEGVTSIGQNAFCRCYNLEVAILPEGLETIEEEAFAFCTSLKTMVIPSTVTEIQAHAFSGCTAVTDVYFLMTDVQQLDDFNWWDGIYHDAPQQAGGMEFNTNQHTVIHVPEGMLRDYVASEKFVAWIPLEEDDNCYPLWWIVNYGVVWREYTVSDDLTAVYHDKNGCYYAKDDNHWLTPDKLYPGEIDYMKMTEIADIYDQSNWVLLKNVVEQEQSYFIDHLIKGSSITGTLVDKYNPAIRVSDEAALKRGDLSRYEKNVYIPASFMGRTQIGANYRTYAFVQPKPQEIFHMIWSIYSEDEECFYLPNPDVDNGINTMRLKGGVQPCYDLYESESVPQLVDCGIYAFNAINRRTVADEERRLASRDAVEFLPYTDGGISDTFTVFPLELPEEPIITGITDIIGNRTPDNEGWFSIDGRFLGNTKPTDPGLYIHRHTKVVIR